MVYKKKDFEIELAKYLIVTILRFTYKKVLGKDLIKDRTTKKHKDGTITIEFTGLEKARAELDKLCS